MKKKKKNRRNSCLSSGYFKADFKNDRLRHIWPASLVD